MKNNLVSEILVPAEHGRAYTVKKGQTMRIIAIEGAQVGDMIIYNANNYKEVYDPAWSYLENGWMGTGSAWWIKNLYSRPPKMNLMMEITEDTVQRHLLINGGRCNPISYRVRNADKPRRNCFENLVEAIAPYGLTAEDVPYVFLLWMTATFSPQGVMKVTPSPARVGDYTDFLAHMDCLVALSACPADVTGVTPVVNINGGINKPLKVEIYD